MVSVNITALDLVDQEIGTLIFDDHDAISLMLVLNLFAHDEIVSKLLLLRLSYCFINM